MSETNSNDLLCCPFCGSHNSEAVGGSYPHFGDSWRIGCNNCLSHGPMCDSEYGAWQEWNRRAT